MKRAAAHSQIMKPIDHESAVPIWLITHTSDTGVGAWVGHGETADTARPAGLDSRKFSNAQMNYGTTDKEALSIVYALTAFHHLLAGNEFTIVTDHQPLMYLKTSRTPTKKQLRWWGYIDPFRTRIIYQPGQWNYLEKTLYHAFTQKTKAILILWKTLLKKSQKTTPLLLPTPPNSIQKTCLDSKFSRLTTTTTTQTVAATAVSIKLFFLLDPSDYRNKNPIINWCDYRSISSGQSDEEIAQSAQHWSDCFVLMCPVHEDDKIMNKVYAGELHSSPPPDNLQERTMQDGIDSEINEKTILSPRPHPDLSKIKRRLHEALGCTTTHVPCKSPECPVHQARRPSPTKPLRVYGGPLSSHNIIPVIELPKLPHHNRSLYQVYNDIAEGEQSEVTRWERIVNKRDVVQAMNEMENIWREQMIKGYRNDPVYQLAQHSSNTSWALGIPGDPIHITHERTPAYQPAGTQALKYIYLSLA